MSSEIMGLFVLPPFPIICSAMSHWLANLLYYGRTTCFVLHKYYCSPPWCMFDLPRGRAVHRRRICARHLIQTVCRFTYLCTNTRVNILCTNPKPVTVHPPHPPHALYWLNAILSNQVHSPYPSLRLHLIQSCHFLPYIHRIT